MTPDFGGLQILQDFLSSIKPNQLIDLGNKIYRENDFNVKLQNSNPKMNKIGCQICCILAFDSLEDFKLHRQSVEHLNNLAKSLNLSDEKDSLSDKKISMAPIIGSPYFEITFNGIKLQCFKILLASRKDEIYAKNSINLDMFLYNRLKELEKTCIMIALNGGGYFASAIFDNSTKQILCSKTFRRYTSRRKQGGSQSTKDNESSGKIHSAGALIRRENEKKLRDEIQGLFTNWKPHIDRCKLIFSNRDPFLTQEVFQNEYLRIIPFTTYQADSNEICRCYNELIASIKILS